MDILRTILSAVWIEGLHLSHKKCIVALIRALLSTLSVNLVKLARGLLGCQYTFDGQTNRTSFIVRNILCRGCWQSHRQGFACTKKIYFDYGPHYMGTWEAGL